MVAEPVQVQPQLHQYRGQYLKLTPEQEALLVYTEGITCFEGRKGTGKTTAGVALAWNLKEYFGYPVWSSFPLQPAFGDYHYWDFKIFMQMLKELADYTKGESLSVANRALDELMDKKDIFKMVADSVILIPEFYQWADARTPADRAVRLLGYFIAQMRHFRSPVIIDVPSLRWIDHRMRMQIDRVMSCWTRSWLEDEDDPSSEQRWTMAQGEDISNDKPIELEINAIKYQQMFNSWVLTPIRGFASKEVTG